MKRFGTNKKGLGKNFRSIKYLQSEFLLYTIVCYKKRYLKNTFSWAEKDLKNLSLWDNDEPKLETFNFKKLLDIKLPSDFIKITIL